MSLTAEGTSIQDTTDYGLWFDVIKGGPGELAQMAGVDTIIPSSAGFVPMPRVKRGRIIELHGWIKESSLANFRTAEQALLALFDPGDLVTLVMSYGSGTATINAQTEAIVPDAPTVVGTFQQYQIILTSGAPDWTLA
jgi:hypothetical protein